MRAERERLAALLRSLADHAVTADPSADELAEAAAHLARAQLVLDACARRPGKKPMLPDLEDLQDHFGRDPMIGLQNPISPPVAISVEDGVVIGRVTFGLPFEGPPGFVHGGVIASIFDQILGLANVVNRTPGMTGTLTVRYRRPTPLHVALRFEGRTAEVNGRKIRTTGVLRAGDDLTAEAEGTFVKLRADHAAMLFATE